MTDDVAAHQSVILGPTGTVHIALYDWNAAGVYPVDPDEATMEFFALPRRRPLHEWVMAEQPTERMWPVSDPDSGSAGRYP